VAKKLKSNSVSGYCNDSNPFGDPNLTERYQYILYSVKAEISVFDYF
jgi:hypothetical protein